MKISYALLLLIPLLGACTGPVLMGADAATIYATKPDAPPPADLQSQIPEHESWCYKTMGYAECYAHAQNVPPERLINVDPANRYPLTLHDYHGAVSGKPVLVDVPAEKEALKAEVVKDDAVKGDPLPLPQIKTP